MTPTLHDLSSFFFFLIKKTRLITYTEKTKKNMPQTLLILIAFFFAPVFFLLSTMNVIDVKRQVFFRDTSPALRQLTTWQGSPVLSACPSPAGS